ncbi:MAG: PAS domain S-box protein [Anaerolineales bacterium]|nr:PAS domain S-box protein [Anaerolineales bacterium]
MTPTNLLDSTPEISISRFEMQGFWSGEVIQRRRDGSAIEIWAAVATVRDEAGKTLGAVAVNRDMSVIRQMQRALEKSEAKYRAIVESTQDILCSTDATGAFVFVNHSWRTRLGYTEDEARRLHLVDVVHPSERNHVMRIFRLIAEGAESLPINTVLCNVNGQPLIVEGQVAAALAGEAFGGIHAYLHDVTDRKFAETAQHEAELQFRNLFEEAPFMYAIVHERNSAPTIVDCNALFVQSLGYAREELVGKPIRQLMVQPSPTCVALFAQTHNRRGLYGEAECTLQTNSGQVLEALLRTRNERDEAGHVLGVRAMFVDISERKQMERQLRANSEQLHALSRHIESVREEEQTRIAREIHDELGQMLTALKMDVTWLTHQVDAGNAAILRKLAAMNDHLGDAIRAVRRIASDLRPPILDQFGLIDALEWLSNQVTERNGVQCTFIDQGDAVVMWDSDLATALFRIAQEALTNVVRHADAAHAWLTLQVTASEIRLEVRDDGVGIAADRVADPHSFGLIGIRERLFPWNGRATIAGTPHEGTIVTVVIPRHPQSRNKP